MKLEAALVDAAPVAAFVGMGANLGDAAETLRAALQLMSGLPQTRLVRCSSFYETAPVDAEGPPFVNAVAEFSTSLSAPELLSRLHAIEATHGRERPYLNAPRTLDLDLLLYAGVSIDTPALVLPHPRMHQRAFVLVPLLEIAPEAEIPGRGRAASWLGAVSGQFIHVVQPFQPNETGPQKGCEPR